MKDKTFNAELYNEVKSWVIWPTVQNPEVVIKAIAALAVREYNQGWKDARATANRLQRNYNKTSNRLASERHRYHKKIQAFFENCRLCNPLEERT